MLVENRMNRNPVTKLLVLACDFLVLITTFAGLVAIASHHYPRMGE